MLSRWWELQGWAEDLVKALGFDDRSNGVLSDRTCVVCGYSERQLEVWHWKEPPKDPQAWAPIRRKT